MRFPATLTLLLLSAASVFAADVTGSWTFTVDTPNGKFESTLELKQTGDQVSGTLHNQFGDSALSGTVKESEVALVQKLERDGQSMTITYGGKVDSGTPAKITGTFKFGDRGEGEFLATKK